jgi:deoxyribonuclease V
MDKSSHFVEKLPDLHSALWRLLSQVPRGLVTTYGRLAKSLGDIAASRWVGEYLRHHQHHHHCPCHRVVRVDGTLGVYVSGDTRDKALLLEGDGVPVRNQRVDLDEYVFEEFESERPLQQLIDWQNELGDAAKLTIPRKLPRWVGGVDVSYGRHDLATAAYTLVDITTGELVWQITCSRPVEFPYISSYLAFRELPILLDVIDLASGEGQLSDVVMVDGSGVLHPRRCGVATMLGVIAGIATIGVTKKLLCGRYDGRRLGYGRSMPIELDGEQLGTAILPHAGTSKPLHVSPGHRVDVATAAAVVSETIGKHHLPEPIYWADRVSREESHRAAMRGEG